MSKNIVSNLYNEMMIVKNTFIKKEFIRKNANDWQSYLETIADFISLWEVVSWCQSENGIEFYNTNLSQAIPELHHYRSWNLHEEQEYLREKWQYCQDNPTTIPAQSIKIYNSEGNLTTKKVLNNLAFLPKLSSPSKHEDQTDDILKDVKVFTANCIKQKMDIISKLKVSLGI